MAFDAGEKSWTKIYETVEIKGLIVTIAVLIAYYAMTRFFKKGGHPPLPPGPYGVPLLGYLPFIGGLPHKTFSKLAYKFGQIFSLTLGCKTVVVLNSYEIIREAFLKQGEIMSDRPEKNFFLITNKQQMAGITGKPRLVHRKFLDKCLKDQGLGTSTCETQIMEEIQHFIEKLQEMAHTPKPASFIKSLGVSVSNNTCVLVFGRRFDYDDQRFLKIKKNEDELTELYKNTDLMYYVRTVNLFQSKSQRMRKLGKEFARFCKEIIKDHQEKPLNFQSTDYINQFLEKQANCKTTDPADKGNFFTEPQLIGNLHALYGGGSETVQHTIQWAILYLLHHPEIQSRIHDELDQVIGRERLISVKDRPKTPYLDATIMEVERIVSVIPINLPHSNTARATTLGGYYIPKGTQILANLWHVHHDPQIWKDPETFKPERFLTSNGASRPNHLIPFSIGRTSCPGETLAKIELYLYLGSMLQRFSFHPADKGSLPNLEPANGGLTLPTEEYSVILKSR